ncbi:MAG: sugar-binding domain-containing protein [Bacteroidales bacterium]
MKSLNVRKFFLIFSLSMFSVFVLYSREIRREIINFNFEWKFYRGDVNGASARDFDDSGWRSLDLPHDWSIEGPFSNQWASGTGYLPGGIGWYRKTFDVPGNWKKGKVFILFEGVYNKSEIWINGNYLGKRPNGYISFYYDLTPYLIFGKNNTIAVKVDHTKYADSRWYTGSGIYRNVKLIFTPEVHAGIWGVNYTIPVIRNSDAEMSVNVNVVNHRKKNAEAEVINILYSDNKEVAQASSFVTIPGSGQAVAVQNLKISRPILWSVDDPYLYRLVTKVKGKGFHDETEVKAGIRYFSFDPNKGFSLNGTAMKLKGVCLHHDAGVLGTAIPRSEIERRLSLLKEMGCNAIRTSHNPYSPDFLDVCDSMGFLVINEAFDEWELPKKKWIEGWNKGTPGKDGYAEYFKEWAIKDLTDFVMRDRNHPSVIMWSIGNEIDYPNDPYTHPILNTEANPQTWAKFDEKLPHADRLGEVARELVVTVKKYDITRPVTAGLASALMSNETGYAVALDVVGYNYQEFRYEKDHQAYPERPLYGSENGMSLEAWKAVEDNDYVAGQFLWTGIEYLGEAGQYPSRHSTSGLIDLAGNKKPEFYFRQSLWSSKPMVFLGTTASVTTREPSNIWAHKRVDPVWNYKEGQTISVNAFTNCEEVELVLNGKSIGTKRLSDFQNRTISWDIPFEPGELKATGKNNGIEVTSYSLKTYGKPEMIKAMCDAMVLKADRTDISRIYVTITDKDGNIVYNAENEITCEITGPVRLLGMEDANPRNIESYKDNKQKAFHGKLLIYLQSEDRPGKANIKISSEGFNSLTFTLDIVER